MKNNREKVLQENIKKFPQTLLPFSFITFTKHGYEHMKSLKSYLITLMN